MTWSDIRHHSKHHKGMRVSFLTSLNSNDMLLLPLYFFGGLIFVAMFIRTYNENSWTLSNVLPSICYIFILSFTCIMVFLRAKNQKQRLLNVALFVKNGEHPAVTITHDQMENCTDYILRSNGQIVAEWRFRYQNNTLTLLNLFSNTKEAKWMEREVFPLVQKYHNEHFEQLVKPHIEKELERQQELLNSYMKTLESSNG